MRMITWKDETHSIAEWAKNLKMPVGALRNRINSGWPLDRAFTEPVKERRKFYEAPCGARSMRDCFKCQLADCTLPGSVKLGDE